CCCSRPTPDARSAPRSSREVAKDTYLRTKRRTWSPTSDASDDNVELRTVERERKTAPATPFGILWWLLVRISRSGLQASSHGRCELAGWYHVAGRKKPALPRRIWRRVTLPHAPGSQRICVRVLDLNRRSRCSS